MSIERLYDRIPAPTNTMLTRTGGVWRSTLYTGNELYEGKGKHPDEAVMGMAIQLREARYAYEATMEAERLTPEPMATGLLEQAVDARLKS